MKRERNINLDLIRCAAVWSVISVHFFLHNGFYSEVVTGKRMACLVSMRSFFMVCVPLFLTLTGYLMNQKIWNKSYYKGIWKTYCVYVLASVVCILVKKYLYLQHYTIKDSIFAILGFKGAAYSWYVNMYIGLFMLIPFLNLIWNGIESKKQHKILVVTFLGCTMLPSIFNIFEWRLNGFWSHPITAQQYDVLVPDLWMCLYPITYYFIGCYIKRYDIKLKVKYNIGLIIGTAALFGLFNTYRNYGREFQEEIYSSYSGFECVILTVLIFLLLLHIDLRKLPAAFKWLIGWISKVSLGIYLVSEIFDQYMYPRLNDRIEGVPMRLEYYFIVVPLIFGLSAILSQIILWCYAGLSCLAKKIRSIEMH